MLQINVKCGSKRRCKHDMKIPGSKGGRWPSKMGNGALNLREEESEDAKEDNIGIGPFASV
eukprot:scaffold1386_cov342-Pavlova_lutheri.AAC.18